MSDVASALLLTRRDGPVEYVTLNRPEVRNAFNEHLIEELTRWSAAIAADTSVRAVVLSGAGPVFCAGADIDWMARTAAQAHDDNVRDASRAAHLFAQLDRLPVPLIARVHGAALGGGAGLAAVSDIVVATDTTRFGFTEVKLGILPAVIAPYVVRKIGVSATRELFLSGQRLGAARAREIGLVHAVVPETDLDTRTAQYLRDILSAGPGAIAAAKALISNVIAAPPAAVTGLTIEALAAQRGSAEGREGLHAFLEKRRPAFDVSSDPDR